MKLNEFLTEIRTNNDHQKAREDGGKAKENMKEGRKTSRSQDNMAQTKSEPRGKGTRAPNVRHLHNENTSCPKCPHICKEKASWLCSGLFLIVISKGKSKKKLCDVYPIFRVERPIGSHIGILMFWSSRPKQHQSRSATHQWRTSHSWRHM